MPLNDVEEEVILLKAVWELIDSMVNFEMLQLLGQDPDSSIMFETMTHQRFFNIVLVDFLSVTDKRAFIRQTSYLGALKKISASPNFDVNNSVAPLSKATNEFSDWLNQEIEVHKIWLPSARRYRGPRSSLIDRVINFALVVDGITTDLRDLSANDC